MSSALDLLLSEPLDCIKAPYDEGFTLTARELQDVQLIGIQRRFSSLRDKVPALGVLADDANIREICDIEAVVPLLFPHTFYKSYPTALIEERAFAELTRWFSNFTAVDTSQVELTGVSTIDDWLDRISQFTELRIIHTFGTSGKLSFLPRTRNQLRFSARLGANCIRDWNGRHSARDVLTSHISIIAPTFRYGASAMARILDVMVEMYAGGDENALFLYPRKRYSADVVSLSGRLRAAAATGAREPLALSRQTLSRQAEYRELEATRPKALEKFLESVLVRYAGRDVLLFVLWPVLYQWTRQATEYGKSRLFSEGSILMTGGGTKGEPLPDDYREQILGCLGLRKYLEFYGMTELMANCPKCDVGHYHIPPVLVPFVLDSTGTPLPRCGRQKGRFAVFDLAPTDYWGGFITGDEVTLAGFDNTCVCGRRGPYVENSIRRISVEEGGVDKVSCGGADRAYEQALNYLVRVSLQ